MSWGWIGRARCWKGVSSWRRMWCLTWLVHPKSRSWWEKTSGMSSSLDWILVFHSGGTGESPKSILKLTSECGCGGMETFCDIIWGDIVSSVMMLNGDKVMFCSEWLETMIGVLWGEWLGSLIRQLFTKRPPGRISAAGSIKAHLLTSGELARMKP